jgi:hypothetical protein
MAVTPAPEAFAQFAPNAASGGILIGQQQGFTVGAEMFLTFFHRAAAWCNRHRANLHTVFAVFASIRAHAKRMVYVAGFSAPDETYGIGFPDLGANSYAPPA